jgi:hypothetical protein
MLRAAFVMAHKYRKVRTEMTLSQLFFYSGRQGRQGKQASQAASLACRWIEFVFAPFAAVAINFSFLYALHPPWLTPRGHVLAPSPKLYRCRPALTVFFWENIKENNIPLYCF